VPFVVSWTICMHIYNPNQCWKESFEFSHSWFITFPIVAFLLVSVSVLSGLCFYGATHCVHHTPFGIILSVCLSVRLSVCLWTLVGKLLPNRLNISSNSSHGLEALSYQTSQRRSEVIFAGKTVKHRQRIKNRDFRPMSG